MVPDEFLEFYYGKYKIVDLHNMTKEDAKANLIYAISSADFDIKCLVVVHGYHGGTIIKNLVRKEFLSDEIQEKKSISSFEDLLALSREVDAVHENSQNESSLEKEDVSDEPADNENELGSEKTTELENILSSENLEEVVENNNIEEDNLELQTKEDAEDTEQSVENEEVEIFPEIIEYDQMRCKNLLVKALLDPSKKIIGFSAPEGFGKSTVLKYLFEDLKNQPRAWFWGECS